MIFDKDENGWLDQSQKDRKGKIIAIDLAIGIYESQDNNLKDQTVEYNKKSKTQRGAFPEDGKAKIYEIAVNPTIKIEEFNEKNKEECILRSLSIMREKVINEIDSVLIAYVDEYYPEMKIDINRIKEYALNHTKVNGD